jgi:predicted DNA-binding transcriptional regulator YafY
MRHEKAGILLELARRLASSAEGMTLDEMALAAGVGRRTAERMRDALSSLFPQMEDVSDGAVKRFRIPNGLDGLFQAPTTEELLELNKVATALRESGSTSRAKALEALETKIRSAMRAAALRRMAPDVEALARAEMIAIQAGPRPYEDETLIATIRQALMAMKALRFVYSGGRTPGAVRTVAPYGLIFGRVNYLVAAEVGGADARNWRLDKLKDVEILDLAAIAPESFSLQGYADRSFGVFQGDMEDVVLRIVPESADEGLAWRFHPSQTSERQPDGSLIVRFQASGMQELAWHLFTWEDALEILAPTSLRELLLGNLARATAWHQKSSSSETDVSAGRVSYP